MAHVLLITNFGSAIIKMRGTFITALIERGHRVTICAPKESEAERQALSALGAQLLVLSGSRTGTNPISDFRYMLDIRRIYRRTQPDMVLAFSSKPVIYSAIAAFLLKKPVVYGVITGLGFAYSGRSAYHRFLATIVSVLYKLAFTRCRTVFFQNADDRALFVSSGLLRETQGTVVEGDGVDLEYFQPGELPADNIFLIIARLLRDKGVYEFVDAARRVRRERSDTVFRIVGWFDDNPAAITPDEVRAWVAEGIVEFLGFSADVRRELAACKVYVLPSYREGLPRTTVEAMAMGRPIITTDVPGCRATVVVGRNGWVVPARDSEQLAAAMMEALGPNKDLEKYGAESRSIAEQRFGTERIIGLLLSKMNLA